MIFIVQCCEPNFARGALSHGKAVNFDPCGRCELIGARCGTHRVAWCGPWLLSFCRTEPAAGEGDAPSLPPFPAAVAERARRRIEAQRKVPTKTCRGVLNRSRAKQMRTMRPFCAAAGAEWDRGGGKATQNSAPTPFHKHAQARGPLERRTLRVPAAPRFQGTHNTGQQSRAMKP